MTRPSKKNIRPNQDYLKSWDEFRTENTSEGPILLPISIDIADGVIVRKRLKSGQVSEILETFTEEFERTCLTEPKHSGDCPSAQEFKSIFDDYIEAFIGDNSQGPLPDSPLDFKINRPVWFLFYLPRDNWKFSEHRQYSIENDRDDFRRNIEKICTLDDNRVLLLANHMRSAPKDLKYNLHVTISQDVDGKPMQTDIIIDPGMDNDEDDDIQR